MAIIIAKPLLCGRNVAHFTRIKAVYKKAVVLFGQHKVKQAACVFI